MPYTINDVILLRKILWIDAVLGASTAVIGFLFLNSLPGLLGLTANFILIVSCITFCYSIVAVTLAIQNDISIPLVRGLVYGNWLWAFVSAGLLVLHVGDAELLGRIFLVLQIIVVVTLAYFEGKQLKETH